MSASPSSSMPRRSVSPTALLPTLIITQLRMLLRARKTIALFIIQLIPVVAALFYVVLKGSDGLTLFGNIVENVSYPFLVPLIALFYGGPTIVDEMEGRTLTYLTLRPIPKPLIYLGKLIAGCVTGVLLITIPMLLLFLVCLITSEDLGAAAPSMLQMLGGASLGVLCYTTVFAALGAMFTRSIISSIVYFVIFEMVLATLPVLELLSIRYYLRTIAEFNAGDRLGLLDQFILDKPIVFPIWAGILVVTLISLFASAFGAYVFKEKQYVV